MRKPAMQSKAPACAPVATTIEKPAPARHLPGLACSPPGHPHPAHIHPNPMHSLPPPAPPAEEGAESKSERGRGRRGEGGPGGTRGRRVNRAGRVNATRDLTLTRIPGDIGLEETSLLLLISFLRDVACGRKGIVLIRTRTKKAR